MIPTLQYICDTFDKYNQLCFGGQLTRPPIILNTRYGSLGQTRRTLSKDAQGNVIKNITIEISVRRDLPEYEYIDTIVHEMIHYYILVNDIADDSPHGHVFQSIEKRINEQCGMRLAIFYDPDEETLIGSVSNRWRYVCVLEYRNGKYGITVAVKNHVFDIWDYFNHAPDVKSAQWYVSNRQVFERFAPMSRPGAYHIEQDKIEPYLTGAKKLIRENNIIRIIND